MTAMKHIAASLGAAALIAGSAIAAGTTAADIAALEAVDQAWVKAFNANNAEAAAVLYDEKAVLLPPGDPAVAGRAAIKAYLAKGMAEASKAGISFSLAPKPAGGVSGNMGWQSGSYTVTDKAGKVIEAGKYLSVSTKKGGKWLYVRDTWNTDAAPPPAAPAPAAPKK